MGVAGYGWTPTGSLAGQSSEESVRYLQHAAGVRTASVRSPIVNATIFSRVPTTPPVVGRVRMCRCGGKHYPFEPPLETTR